MMESSKQESVSRQSSILKPPKQRQPLQCVAANPSSSENSPTIKIKRRVSFAKNRRIREFCNEDEQGTVWDETYEEHDLSNNKNSSSDQPIIITVPCDDKENFPVQLFLPNNELTCKEVPPSLSNEKDNLLPFDMEMDNSINDLESPCIQMENRDIEYPNTTIYYDDGMDITVPLPTNIIPCHNQYEDYLDDTVPISRIQNISMELTENVLATFYKKPSKSQSNKNEILSIDTVNSTELTQVMSKLLGIGSSNKLINKIKSNTFNHTSQITEDKTDYLDNEPMEFTSVLPSSTWIRPDSKCQNNEKTENLTKTMEFTAAVSNINIQNIQQNVCNISEKTQIFPNKSMEMTEAISTNSKIASKTIHERTKHFPNLSMEITDVISTHRNFQKSNSHINVYSDKEQNNISTKSMEMTEAVSVYQPLHYKEKPLHDKIEQDRTEIFDNKSMEMTEAISNNSKMASKTIHEGTKLFPNFSMEITDVISSDKNFERSDTRTNMSTDKEKTNIFNKSMEMTEVVPVYNIVYQSDTTANKIRNKLTQRQSIALYNKPKEMSDVPSAEIENILELQEKTRIFQNKSVNISETIPIQQNFVNNQKLQKIQPEIHHNRTKIFQDKSMDVTETIPVHQQVLNINTNNVHHKIGENKLEKNSDGLAGIMNKSKENFYGHTKLTEEPTHVVQDFHDMSMDLTSKLCPLPIVTKCQSKSNISKTNTTTVYHNTSMELTSGFPISQSVIRDHSNQQNENKNLQYNDVLEAVDISQNQLKNTSQSTQVFSKFDRDKKMSTDKNMGNDQELYDSTKPFTDTSMKLTKIPSFSSTAMEMTEAISTNSKIASKTIHERTKHFPNLSMEITDVISTHRNFQKSNSHINVSFDKEQNNISTKSMEMTEAVSVYQPLHYKEKPLHDKIEQDRTEIFGHKSMEMTEAISTNSKIASKTIHEGTKLFPNLSMEITDVISTHKNFQKSNSHINMPFDKEHNNISTKSMEMTEAVSVYQPLHYKEKPLHDKIEQDRTEIFGNKSMEMTEAISTNSKIASKTIHEGTKLFPNLSMEITDVISTHKNFQKSNSHINISFDKEHNNISTKSMEMTEAVSVYQPLHYKEKPLHDKIEQDRTEIFSNKSMEMTEAISTNSKMASKTIHEGTKLFPNLSMEITDVISSDKNFERSDTRTNMSTDKEKTNIFNKSMEMTEVVPVYNTVYQSDTTTNKIRNKLTQRQSIALNNKPKEMSDVPSAEIENILELPGKTKLFLNKLMDISETIPINHKITDYYRYTKKESDSSQNKTDIDNNKSMDLTEAYRLVKITSSSYQNVAKLDQNLPKGNSIDEKIEYFVNKSIDMSEVIPTQQNILPNTEMKQIPCNNTIEKTRIFQNKSVNISETIPIQQNFVNNQKLQKIQPEIHHDRTKIFQDKSMDITETIPVHQQVLNINTNNVHHKIGENKLEKNSDGLAGIMNKSKENFYGHTKLTEEPTHVVQDFHDMSMDLTSKLCPLPIVTKCQSKSNISKTNTTTVYHNTSMELTSGFPISQSVIRDHSNQQNENKNLQYNDVLKAVDISQNQLKNTSQSTQVFSKFDRDKKMSTDKNMGNDQELYDSTKPFTDTSMKLTKIPSFSSTAKPNRDKYSKNILKNDIENIPSSISTSNNFTKENNFEITGTYKSREDNFHRMTSDELNSLCASMNLPTQKYDKDYSITTRNDYISVCNDVNVLRDSLEKNNIFQNGSIITTKSTFSEKDKSLQICTSSTENLNKENSYWFSDMGTSKQALTEKEALKNDVISTKVSQIPTNSGNKSLTQNNINISTTEMLCETIPIQMEIDKTAEVSIKYLEPKQLCSTVTNFHDGLLNTDKHPKHLNPIQNQENVYFSCAKNINDNKHSNMEIDIINTINNGKCSNQLVQKSNRVVNVAIDLKKGEQLPKGEIDIYHDLSMEFTAVLPTEITTKQKPEKLDKSKNKNKTSILNTAEVSCETTDKNKDDNILDENSLSRLPSDNTELLLATMGFKTELSHPLIINDKTTITISGKSFADKTYTVNSNLKVQDQVESNKTYSVNATSNVESNVTSNNSMNNQINNKCGSLIHTDIPNVVNDPIKGHVEDECDSSDKENKEPSVRVNLFPEKYCEEEELEEIEPPSFLCFDSIQDGSLQNNEIINIDQCNEVHNNKYNEIQNMHGQFVDNEDIEKKNTLINEDIIKVIPPQKHKKDAGEELKTLNYDLYVLLKKTKEKNEKLLSLRKDNKKQSKEDMICENMSDKKINLKLLPSKKDNKMQKEDGIRECVNDEKDELLSAFASLTRNIKLYEKSNDCIWRIRNLSTNIIAVDFIAKSFVIIIKLNAIEKACVRDIDKVEIFSRLRTDASNLLLRTVHNILLLKLNTNEMLAKYKMYEDILPMLEYISNEVIFTMNFMFDLERLQALNLLSIDEERIIFMVSSRKANIILKVSLVIKIFHEIGPNDIDVTCILGDIRKKDIKQMIINIRKDSRFLSRYINDIKEYITLMEESINPNKY